MYHFNGTINQPLVSLTVVYVIIMFIRMAPVDIRSGN